MSLATVNITEFHQAYDFIAFNREELSFEIETDDEIDAGYYLI